MRSLLFLIVLLFVFLPNRVFSQQGKELSTQQKYDTYNKNKPLTQDSLLKGRDLIADTSQSIDMVLSPIYVKENVGTTRKPIPYHHLREADVMWKKKIWRMLDLREKINHPLYYPINRPMDDRFSLADLIIKAVSDQNVDEHRPVYVYEDDEFVLPISLKEFAVGLGQKTDTIFVDDIDANGVITGNHPEYISDPPNKDGSVKRFVMKEVWFFDKQRSKLEVRIVALQPIAFVEREVGGTLQTLPQEGGWIPFGSLRYFLAKQEVFNPNNDAERRTFDEIFFKRHFSSYIIEETNVFENRRINSYKFGQDALLEGEKVKQFIFKVEHDLWEF